MGDTDRRIGLALGEIGRRGWKWLAGIVVGALATLLGASVTGLLDEMFPSPVEMACWFQEWGTVHNNKTVSAPKFTILVSRLDRDTDGSQTRHVVYALERQTALEVIPTCRVLRIEPHGDRWSEARIEAETLGRQWLKERGADLLLWGEASKANQVLELRFTSLEDKHLEDKKAVRASRYKLDDTLILPRNFHEDFAEQLVAVALSSISPVTEQAGTYQAAVLRPVAAKLRRILDRPTPSLTASQKAALQDAFGLAAITIGEQTREKLWLEQAITVYRAALQKWTRERNPLQWAVLQLRLGHALGKLGEEEAGTARLEESISAFRAALEEQPREYDPLQWAVLQNNLGVALTSLSHREGSTLRLEEAVGAFRAALEEQTREHAPLQWAGIQMNLGRALRLWGELLGEQEAGRARLEEAVAIYRVALEERTRDRVPLQWAMLQYHLGVALTSLSHWEAGTTRLEEAVGAFRAALEEQTRERVPLQWAEIQQSLGSALITLGIRMKQLQPLQEALEATKAARAAYRDATMVHDEATLTRTTEALEAMIATFEGH